MTEQENNQQQNDDLFQYQDKNTPENTGADTEIPSAENDTETVQMTDTAAVPPVMAAPAEIRTPLLFSDRAPIPTRDGEVEQEVFEQYKAKFTQQMGNDLNTSMGVTALYDVLKAKTNDNTKLAILHDYDRVLSLNLMEKAAEKRAELAKAQAAKSEGGYTITGEGDPTIDAMVLARYEAKKAKNFAEADRIRDELKAMGIEVTDVPGGANWKRV